MIVCTFKKEIGEIFLSSHPMELRKGGELANMKVIRQATAKEFIDYWQANDPIRFKESVDHLGVPPETSFYYEVSCD